MTAVLKRRLAKIEEAVLPKPTQTIPVLIEPVPGADMKTKAAFLENLKMAKSTHGLVVVVSSDGRADRRHELGVQYVASEIEALMIVISCQPSEQGRPDKLCDVLSGLSGNVIGANNYREQAR